MAYMRFRSPCFRNVLIRANRCNVPNPFPGEVSRVASL